MPSKSERTQQFILEKSINLFNTKGYENTHIQDITKAVGMTKGAIYGNFETKQELMIAAFEYGFQKVNALMTNMLAEGKTASEKLFKMIEYFDIHFQEPPFEGGCLMLNAAIEADDNNPELQVKVSKAFGKWQKSITKILQQGIENKEIKESVNCDEFADLFIASLEGALMLSKIRNSRLPLKHTQDFLKRLIIRDLQIRN
ncbi:MAG: TetR/AcrR family transcriptional regulator [Flammeovirgaceae bacterium]